MSEAKKPRPQGPSIGARRTKAELYRSQVRGWQKGPSKEIAKDLLYLLRITLDDLADAQEEIKRLRANR